PDAGHVGDLDVRLADHRNNVVRIAFDSRGGIAIAANAESVLAGDFHQVGGFRQHAGDFAVLHSLPIFALLHWGSSDSIRPMGKFGFSLISIGLSIAASAVAQTPLIQDVVSSASHFGTGLPSGGVAPGSIVSIVGVALGPDPAQVAG